MRQTAMITLSLVLLAGACGSDDKKSTETREQFGARIGKECPGADPGFDAFMTAHATPTADDYVKFLPNPIAMMTGVIDCIGKSNPPVVLKDPVDKVVAALKVVKADLESALKSAKSGDLDATNTKIGEMQAHVGKVDEAEQAVVGPPGS